MKSKLMIVAMFFCLAAIWGIADAYEALQGPTELRYWDKARAYNGYTVFAAAGTSYLLDMSGEVVHTWRIGTNPRLLDNGHLLDASKDDPSGFQGFQELDWDGNVVWEYLEKRPGYAPHHDWERIYNKPLKAYTTLYIANRPISNDEAIGAGCDPAKGPYDGAQMDAIVEVDMSGAIVWIGVGGIGCPIPPPSEPDVRVSRIRLSGRWFYRRADWQTDAWAAVIENSPRSVK